MKFSKLIKSDNKRKEMKLKRNAVLLSGMYGDIATKSPVVNNYFTPMKTPTTATCSEELDNTLVPNTPLTVDNNKTPFRSSPLSKLFEFKSSAIDKTCRDPVANAMAKQKLMECLLETPRIGLVGNKAAITPRVTKSGNVSKPKRLQRRAEYVTARPANYALRSSKLTAAATEQKLSFTPLFKKYESPKPKNLTPVTQNAFKLSDTPTSEEKPQSALSKIKKFVSKSALKVINNSGSRADRKSLGSACSSTSSLSSAGSCSDDSFCNISMEQKRININLERLIDDEKQPKSSWSYQPIKHTTDNTDSNVKRVPRPNGITKSVRPSMGMSAVMLKNLKAKNPTVSYAHCMPNMYLVAVPHVFKSDKFAELPKASVLVRPASPEESNYDHLTRVNYSAMKQKSKFQKNKSCSNTATRLFASNGNVGAKEQSPKSIKISLYSKNQKHLSAVNLNESQQYDTIIF